MLNLILFALVVGLTTGLYYSFMSLGLNIIFGLMRMINIAHGDIVMLGGFSGFFLYELLGLGPWYSILISIPIFFLFGSAIYIAFIPRLSKTEDPEINSFLLFFGLSIIIEYAASIFFGTTNYTLGAALVPIQSIDVFGFILSFKYIAVAAISVSFILATVYYLRNTKLGLATRAVMFSGELATCYGINPNRVSFFAFAYSIAITGVAGILSPYVLFSLQANEGTLLTIIAFSIIMIGSLGNPLGTIIGGLTYGIVTNLAAIYIPGWSITILFAVLVLIILFRPNGLLGGRIREI